MLFQYRIAVQIAADDFPFRKGQTNTFNLPCDLEFSQIREIGLHFSREAESFKEWALAGLEVEASVEVDRGFGPVPQLVRLYSRQNINKLFADDGEWWEI